MNKDKEEVEKMKSYVAKLYSGYNLKVAIHLNVVDFAYLISFFLIRALTLLNSQSKLQEEEVSIIENKVQVP